MWLDDSGTEAGNEAQVDREALIESLQDQVAYLRGVLSDERDACRRADTIITQLTQANAALAARVPELEAPAGERPPDVPRGEAGGASREEAPPTQEGAQGAAEPRSWWRRVFGG